MVPEPDNHETEKFAIDEETSYGVMKEKSVDELMSAFRKLKAFLKDELVDNYCLARCFSCISEEGSRPLSEEIKLEFLKERGRNRRAALKSDVASDDDDTELFQRP